MTHLDGTRLNDYLDGLLEGEERERVVAHLESCPECRDRVSALRGLEGRLASLPREILPRRDLRPGIRARIDQDPAPEAGTRVGVQGAEPRPSFPGPWLKAAAVLALLALGSLGLWSVMGPEPEGAAGLDAVIASYAGAADELSGALQRRSAELDPLVVQNLEANLAAVDAAIGELRHARVPATDQIELARHLEARYRTKLGLLRDAMERLEDS